MNRTQVLEKIQPILDLDVRNIEHTPRTRVMVAPGAVVLRPGDGRRHLELSEGGVKSMAKFAGFPEGLAKNLSPDTFGRVATELLEHSQPYGVCLKEGMVVSFGKLMSRRQLDPERVLKTVEQSIKFEDYNSALLLPDYAVSLDIVGGRRLPVAKGDLVQAGATVAFSPIGTMQPLVQSYILRLACTNGATTQEVMRELQYGGGGGDGDDVWQWFRQSVREAYQSVEHTVAHWRNLKREHVRAMDRPGLLEALLRRSGMTGTVAEAVRARALEEPPRNAYDMMNLITWASTHVLEEPRAILRARQVADGYAREMVHRKLCPVCHRQS